MWHGVTRLCSLTLFIFAHYILPFSSTLRPLPQLSISSTWQLKDFNSSTFFLKFLVCFFFKVKISSVIKDIDIDTAQLVLMWVYVINHFIIGQIILVHFYFPMSTKNLDTLACCIINHSGKRIFFLVSQWLILNSSTALQYWSLISNFKYGRRCIYLGVNFLKSQ